MLSIACGDDPRASSGGSGASAAEPGRQVAQTFGASSGQRIHYLLYLPRGYRDRGRRWPVLLYLHGADLLGSGPRALLRLRRQGIPKVVDRRGDFPFIAVSPQTRSGWRPAELARLLDQIQRRYAVDGRRVYATGFSLGGYGVWELASAYPRRFAAIAPIAGGPGRRRTGCRLKDVPLWAFHGTADEVVPPSESRAMVRAVRRCGGSARLTLYRGAGHFIAERTYSSAALLRWLGSKVREPGRR